MTVPENVENQNYGRPIDPSEIVPEPKPAPPGADETQGTKWNIFKRKPKQTTNFENPIYAEMDNEQKEAVSVPPPPSPPLPAKASKRNSTPGYTATEDTFKDTANLVKEDSDV